MAVPRAHKKGARRAKKAKSTVNRVSVWLDLLLLTAAIAYCVGALATWMALPTHWCAVPFWPVHFVFAISVAKVPAWAAHYVATAESILLVAPLVTLNRALWSDLIVPATDVA